jgi:phospho-N-acetylmuramoyl-pentapeptide-transferase
MLYHLFDFLQHKYHLSGAGLFQYISFRAGLAIVLSLLISVVFGERVINFLRGLQIGESVRDLGLEGQKKKEGTPTMGGILIILSILVPCLLFAKLNNVYIILMILATVWMGIIGFADDYIKVFKKDKEGLRGKFKVLGQVVLGCIIGAVMFFNEEITVRMPLEEAEAYGYEQLGQPFDTYVLGNLHEMVYVKTTLTNVPFFKGNELDYSKALWFMGRAASQKWAWLIFIPVVIFIVTAVSNAANLTDGIDGLATGTSAIIGATLGILAYVSGNQVTADYLNILFLPESGELVIFSACFLGACIGFLWYNAYPAQVFMGDTGSLTIGGIIAALAVLTRKELLIPVLCGIFLVENLSVVLQVAYFKYTKKKYGEGRRIFLMSPLHHHYQKKGIHESKIVIRFWIVGILLAVLTVVTLKVR